jgi:hypothetical protein
MRITVWSEHAHDDVPLTAVPRRGHRRLAALAAVALLLGLVAEVGIVPGSAGAAFSAQVPADDPGDPCVIDPLSCPAPPPDPDPVPPAPVPDPPTTTTKPTKSASPEPSVAAPKKHHKRKHHTTAVDTPSPTPSAVTSPAVVAFAPATFTSPKKKSAARGPKPKMFIPPVTTPSPSSDATTEATVQEAIRPVSAESRSGHGLLWFAVADLAAIALLVGGSLWRRRRVGPQW